MENLKSKYAEELEKTKTDLEKAKLQFVRYTEKQFELYNALWKVLLYTKQQADMLWEKADPAQIPAFSEQIRLTKNAVNDNLLLIEEEHYSKLIKLIDQFEQFQFGKQKLIDVRADSNECAEPLISAEEMRRVINRNKIIKENYDALIMDIGRSFRSQIKG